MATANVFIISHLKKNSKETDNANNLLLPNHHAFFKKKQLVLIN